MSNEEFAKTVPQSVNVVSPWLRTDIQPNFGSDFGPVNSILDVIVRLFLTSEAYDMFRSDINYTSGPRWLVILDRFEFLRILFLKYQKSKYIFMIMLVAIVGMFRNVTNYDIVVSRIVAFSRFGESMQSIWSGQ